MPGRFPAGRMIIKIKRIVEFVVRGLISLVFFDENCKLIINNLNLFLFSHRNFYCNIE